jgi:hypothetical protein
MTSGFELARLPALPTGVQTDGRATLDEGNETGWRMCRRTSAAGSRLSVQRLLNTAPGAAREAMSDHCIAS